MSIILQTNSLSKYYGSLKAVNKLEFSVQAGTVYGILGPNGSGKTSTLCMILGTIKADEGNFTWFDGKYENPYLKIGALLETPNFYPYLNAIDNLKITAHIKHSNQDDMDSILKRIGLWDKRNLLFKQYSFGMKQRLAIGATMIGDPDVYIFDEPTNGLDPVGIADMRNVIKTLKSEGKTIIMASHMLDEVEKVCDEVLIIKNGVKLSEKTVNELDKSGKIIILNTLDNERATQLLTSSTLVNDLKKVGNLMQVTLNPEINIEQIAQLLLDEKIAVTHIVEKTARLEDTFLQITKNQ